MFYRDERIKKTPQKSFADEKGDITEYQNIHRSKVYKVLYRDTETNTTENDNIHVGQK